MLPNRPQRWRGWARHSRRSSPSHLRRSTRSSRSAGSAVVGLAAVAGRLDADGVWAAGQLDEIWQAEQWGRDPLAEAGHNDKRAALAAAMRLLALLS